jgi:HEAT repeat protein
VSDVPVPDPGRLPTGLLLRLARREVEDDGDAPTPSLVELHQRPVRELYEAAAALVEDDDLIRRTLGVRILRELGPPDEDGRRPFSAETVPLLRARLRAEQDPEVLGWIISALGYHAAREALPEVLALATHPDDGVRHAVAFALPGLIHPEPVEPETAAVLIRLAQDDDADVRYYALYGILREVRGMDAVMVARLTRELTNEPDDQIRTMAADHDTAVQAIGRLFSTAKLDPAIVALDRVIVALPARLAEEMDPDEIRLIVDDEIRRRGPMANQDPAGQA